MTTHPVYIVGAGPGDPELLTVKALRLLQEYAEIVIYDRLIPDAIIDLIPQHVERVYAGKSCKKHHMTQEQINAELVLQAKAGKKVVRLKGGDPFIFGRGGEEIIALEEAGVAYEAVSGISAASGLSAKYNVPLTHRGVATSVRFITGHQQKGDPVVHDWASLANPECTLVVYMGLANLGEICDNLMQHGLDADTPAIAIQEGMMEHEKSCRGTVSSIAKLTAEQEFKPPVIVIIGQVVSVV